MLFFLDSNYRKMFFEISIDYVMSYSLSGFFFRVLMLAKGTAIHKSFLVPLFALQAPGSIVSWMKYVELFKSFLSASN